MTPAGNQRLQDFGKLVLAEIDKRRATDAPAVSRAAEGVDALIHLAATPDDDDFLTKLLPNNILGAYHVLEAARLAGVRRVVLASSGVAVEVSRFLTWSAS